MVGIHANTLCGNYLTSSFAGSIPLPVWQSKLVLKKIHSHFSVKCENEKDKEKEGSSKLVSVERYPYYSYFDSTSGKMEPASGARASIPGPEYWPEGTASRVRAAQAPEPAGVSTGTPSYGKSPGSRRRKKHKTSASPTSASPTSEPSVASIPSDDPVEVVETKDAESQGPEDLSSQYVTYQTEPDEELTGYALDKKLGNPHPFIDPKVKKPIENALSSEELWWNWRKPDKEQWSRWQRRRPDVETVFLKAMAETGQIKLYGEHPTLTECALYRARRHIFKEERLQAEKERLQEVGPIAYYSEWVKDWKRDTSREAVQNHFEDTGEDENTQLIEMFCNQTDREFRIMMGTDTRVRRDPLAMRMREDQIKQIWGGDPVYPTINYIQEPNGVVDFRGPNFHEPTPDMLSHLKEHGKIITREELDEMIAELETKDIEYPDMDEAMAQAVNIAENEDDEENSEVEGKDEEEKFSRNWSVLKTNPELRKSKKKPKKTNMSLEEAIDDSENLTDFLMDFDEEDM
ncbi:unnamed protein product [Cuscuta epithymum]|uniref:Plastid transcriptionally active 12 n=1 Tax=Cuscuta epithymum TaxID=186058 RepID=A0AAV0DPP8_9ASTE|nr:unnamed protein product [Cuscuta epithymum]CAH9141184.1 unnamed protein product [Cuscuta epithymum]